MRKGRFAGEQVVAMLREGGRGAGCRRGEEARGQRADDTKLAQTLWRDCQADAMKRLKQFEMENARLKKLLAERDPAIEVMKEITAKNG